MKRAIVGLIVLGLAGVASADVMDFVTGGDRSWTNENVPVPFFRP